MNIHSSAAVCWICLEGGADGKGEPLVRDCACRGDDAGFSHTSCIIKYAKKKCEEAMDSHEFVKPWETCPNCNQNYQNDLSLYLSAAFVSYAERTYGYPGNSIGDKTHLMQALRVQIQSTKSGALDRGKESAVHDMENLINKLLAMVDQAKKEHDMERWGNMAPTTYEYQKYCHIRSSFEAFGYYILGYLCSLDKSKASIPIEISYYEKAHVVFKSVGSMTQAKLMMDSIERVKAQLAGDDASQLETTKKIYEERRKTYGEHSEFVIRIGLEYVISLRKAAFSIEAERLVSKLAANSRQVYGEDHNCTQQSVELLNKIKTRLVHMISTESDVSIAFRALRYEDDGNICIQDEEGNIFCTASGLIHPDIGCPVICHGLKNAPHLNGKLGDVRSSAKDKSGEIRFAVHFEDKSLKPAAVKPGNLRIAFDLPSA